MKNTKTIVAIDPGKSGGVAVVHYDNSRILSSVLYNCPDSTKDMANIIRSVENSCIIDDKKLSIVIEHVWSFPTDARSSAFKFGTNYGMWLGIIGAFRFECEKISPQKWMKMYAPLPKNKQERKKKLKEIAKEINDKTTLKTCDALLIANYKREEIKKCEKQKKDH
tara:strand:+ start:369 stop:866 length:498 start_codon:yes stop_codon:yes gene_type:complete